MIVRLLMLLILLFAYPALGGELFVHGDVVQVDPRVERHTRSVQNGDCAPVKPPHTTDLMALIAWDLRTRCTRSEVVDEVITAFRVLYEWDGRRWQTLMQERPGDTIALKVTTH